MKLLSCLLAGLLAWTAAAPAEAGRDGRPPRPESARRDGPSLDEEVTRLRRETGGRVLSAQPRERGRDGGYRIKLLLPDASVRSFDVPARERERR